MENKLTGREDYFGTIIRVGSVVMDFRLNSFVPKVWTVKERDDGLFYCEGEVDGEKTFIGLDQLLDTSGVSLRVLKKAISNN